MPRRSSVATLRDAAGGASPLARLADVGIAGGDRPPGEVDRGEPADVAEHQRVDVEVDDAIDVVEQVRQESRSIVEIVIRSGGAAAAPEDEIASHGRNVIGSEGNAPASQAS